MDEATGEERADWPLYRMRSLPGADAGPGLTLVLQDSVHDADKYSDARLTVEDRETETWIRDLCPDLDKKPLFGWQAARPYLLWSGAAAASIAFLFFFGIPMLAGFLVQVIPDKVQITLGKVVEEQIVGIAARTTGLNSEKLVCSKAEGQEVLEAMVNRLADGADIAFPLSLTVLNVKQINALALPGGRILVFKGLIDFAGHPNALAGVLAHELGHVEKQHPLHGALEKGAAGAVIGLLLGDIAGGAVIAAAVEHATSAAYSREMETEADVYAVRAMRQQGWDIRPFAGFFARLAEKHPDMGGLAGMLSTHPASEDRKRIIEDATTASSTRAATYDEWAAVNAICADDEP